MLTSGFALLAKPEALTLQIHALNYMFVAAIQDIGVMASGMKPVVSPTYL